jgi:hypothetical protein
MYKRYEQQVEQLHEVKKMTYLDHEALIDAIEKRDESLAVSIVLRMLTKSELALARFARQKRVAFHRATQPICLSRAAMRSMAWDFIRSSGTKASLILSPSERELAACVWVARSRIWPRTRRLFTRTNGVKIMMIRNCNLIDCTGKPPYHADVQIQAGKITKIGQNLPADADCDTYDANGAYLLPGLVNLHVHINRRHLSRGTGVFRQGAPAIENRPTRTGGCTPRETHGLTFAGSHNASGPLFRRKDRLRTQIRRLSGIVRGRGCLSAVWGSLRPAGTKPIGIPVPYRWTVTTKC